MNRNNFMSDIKIKDINVSPKSEIIVISDLHGDMRKWKYVKNAIKNNPRLEIIIEGDAMDRGPYGLQILMQIKELSDKGKVEYIPGNHDAFAYNYLRTQGTKYQNSQVAQRAKKIWEYNGGKVTKESFDNFNKIMIEELKSGNISKSIKKEELIEWLGTRPIQRILQENGTKYALGHAVFDTKLYKEDPNFNLERALVMELQGKQNTEVFKRYMNTMWYREADSKTHYASVSFPKDYLMVVGHTRQEKANIKYLDNDPNKPIVYLDCGKGELQGFNLTTRKHVQLEPKQAER